MKSQKVYTIITESKGRTTGYEGTLEKLINCFSYTLEIGNSWNSKIQRNPKTIKGLISNLQKSYDEKENKSVLLEIKNLNLRLTLIRYMQMVGVLCLFLSVFAMLLLFLDLQLFGIYLFGLSLFCLLISLGISFWEISISINALRLHLSDLIDN